jgi:cytidyltransferase-like protein
MAEVIVSGLFDDIRSPDVRFLEEAARLGAVTVQLWSDESLRLTTGRRPVFPEDERIYMLEALRFVDRVIPVRGKIDEDTIWLKEGSIPHAWAATEAEDSPGKRAFCAAHKIDYRVIPSTDLSRFPTQGASQKTSARKKVIVTGCYDWLHSGHIRFFEEASGLGDLYVSLGNDANIRGLKGAGHPLLGEAERLYMVQSIRFVTGAFVAAGFGWLDAEAEIAAIQPDIYVVNEDGDRPEKRAFCETRGMCYVVLKRRPKDGLPSRQSTELRGF